MTTGPLDTMRDISDVAAVAAALLRLGTEPVERAAINNVCTGYGGGIRDLTNILCDLVPFPVWFEPADGNPGIHRAVGGPARLAGDGIVVECPDFAAVLERMLLDAGPLRSGKA